MQLPIPNKEYLHYQVQPERIFDLENYEYDNLEAVISWQQTGKSIQLRVRTSLENQAYLTLKVLAPNIFRIQLTQDSAPVEVPSEMMVKNEWPEFQLKITENSSSLTLLTSEMKIVVHKQPFQVLLFDLNENCILSQNVYGQQRHFFPVYNIGFRRQNEKIVGCYQSLDLRADEHIYGLGEKFNRLDKVGTNAVAWQTDTTNTVSERAYKNIPFFMSTAGYGLFINTSHRIDYEIGSAIFVANSFLVAAEHLEYYVIYGPRFKQILKEYTALTGRAPMPPLWSFGLWMSRCTYKSQVEVESIASELRQQEIPCDVLHLDPDWMRPGHYCDFIWDDAAFPDRKQLFQILKELNFHLCLWEQPYLPTTSEAFQVAKANNFLLKNKQGEVYLGKDFVESTVGWLDFTNPAAVEWYQAQHRPIVREGVSVFKTDMGESVPADAVFFNGKTGAEMHNLYPLLYNKTVFEAIEQISPGEGIVWGRSGWAGSQRFPLNWAGDSHSTFEDMVCTLRAGLSYGLSGVPFWSHDIGGFQGPPPTPELYIRWAQFGLLCSHARCHGIGLREPWHFGKAALAIFRKYTQLRYQLLPYLWSMAYQSTQTGLPMLRPLILEFQEDRQTYQQDLQFLLGDSLLIVPVFNATGKVEFYLPAGKWLDFWTQKILAGPQFIKSQVDLETVPIFIRENSIIPQGPVQNYVGEKPVDPLTLTLFLKDQTDFTLRTDQICQISARQSTTELVIEIGAWSGTLIWKIHEMDQPKVVQTTRLNLTLVQHERDFQHSLFVAFYDQSQKILWIKFQMNGTAEKIIILK